MPATLLTGKNTKATFTIDATIITMKGTKWTCKIMNKIQEGHNTDDGTLRAAGRQDASGTVSAILDGASLQTDDIVDGAIGVLKLYVDATRFVQLTAIIENLNLDAEIDKPVTVDFDYFLQSGTVVLPVTA